MVSRLSARTAWISVDAGDRLFRIANRYASVRACMTILQQYVFAYDMENGSSLPQAVLTDLAKHIMRDALVLGFSVVRVRAGQDPQHLEWGCYRIGVVRSGDGIRRHYTVLKNASQEPFAGAVVLTGFNADPGDDGSINSVMAAVRLKTVVIAQLADCYVTAERNRSCPTTLIERDAERSHAREEPTWDFFADAEADAVEHDEHNSFLRDKFSMTRLDAIENGFEDSIEQGVGYIGNAADDVEGSKRDTTRLANRHAALSSIAHVPSGYKVATQPQPSHAPAGVVSTFQFFEQEIYALMQIPRSMVHQDHERAKVDEQAMQRQLMHTVHAWQDMLQRGLNYVVAASEAPRKRKRRLEVDLREAARVVNFVRVPVASADELYLAYSNSVLPFNTMQKLVLARLGLPTELADTSASAPERMASWVSGAGSKRSGAEEPLSRSRPAHK